MANTKKAAELIAAITAAICFLIVLLYLSLTSRAFDLSFYEKEYKKNSTYSQVGMEAKELMRVTEHMIRYLKQKEPTLNIEAVINGEIRPFFSDRELRHMEDVRMLFKNGKLLFAAASVLGAALICVLLFIKPQIIARVFKYVLLIFLLLSALAALIVILDFERAFTMFHKLFFSNDLWRLDPDIELLINIVPIQFFIDICIETAAYFYSAVITAAAAFAVTDMYKRRAMRI